MSDLPTSKRCPSIRRRSILTAQLVVMQHLARHGPQATGEVARAVSMAQATLSDILERLEGKGLIRRERSQEDKRRVINELTGLGAIFGIGSGD